MVKKSSAVTGTMKGNKGGMMKQPKEIFVFVTHPAYAYRNDEGQMRETSLLREFIADSYDEALDNAIAWARNRFETIIKDYYNESFFSSIKVHVRIIKRMDKNGFIPGGDGQFFEWKYDWLGTIEQYVESWKREHEKLIDVHPSERYKNG